MKKRAFTLVELLIVVTILSILVTMMYPQFEGFRTRARLKEVENTVSLIAAAEKYYRFKTGSWYTWDAAAAAADYVNPGPEQIRDVLNINLPSVNSNDTMCRYLVEDALPYGVWIVIQANDDSETQGVYILEAGSTGSADTYVIDSFNGKWERYLLYLE